MVLTNVELETETVTGPDGPMEVPKKIHRGGGVVNNFIGIEDYDEATGSRRTGTPGVTFRDASPLTSFKDGFDLAYNACLQEASQMYALISGDATASGESRIQALVDFLLRISPYKPEVDEQGSWVLTTALLWAAALANRELTGYTMVYDSRVHVASISAEERRLVMDMRKNGTISRETERVLLGVDDPALEAELVKRERETSVDEITTEEFSERLDVGLKMLSVNIDPGTIQKFLGYSDEQIAKMEEIAAEREAELLDQMGGDGTGAPDGEDVTAATA
jgi:hypothetical protein